MQTILVVVENGLAEVVESTLPKGVEVRIVDIDALKSGYMASERFSKEERRFLREEFPELLERREA